MMDLSRNLSLPVKSPLTLLNALQQATPSETPAHLRKTSKRKKSKSKQQSSALTNKKLDVANSQPLKKNEEDSLYDNSLKDLDITLQDKEDINKAPKGFNFRRLTVKKSIALSQLSSKGSSFQQEKSTFVDDSIADVDKILDSSEELSMNKSRSGFKGFNKKHKHLTHKMTPPNIDLLRSLLSPQNKSSQDMSSEEPSLNEKEASMSITDKSLPPVSSNATKNFIVSFGNDLSDESDHDKDDNLSKSSTDETPPDIDMNSGDESLITMDVNAKSAFSKFGKRMRTEKPIPDYDFTKETSSAKVNNLTVDEHTSDQLGTTNASKDGSPDSASPANASYGKSKNIEPNISPRYSLRFSRSPRKDIDAALSNESNRNSSKILNLSPQKHQSPSRTSDVDELTNHSNLETSQNKENTRIERNSVHSVGLSPRIERTPVGQNISPRYSTRSSASPRKSSAILSHKAKANELNISKVTQKMTPPNIDLLKNLTSSQNLSSQNISRKEASLNQEGASMSIKDKSLPPVSSNATKNFVSFGNDLSDESDHDKVDNLSKSSTNDSHSKSKNNEPSISPRYSLRLSRSPRKALSHESNRNSSRILNLSPQKHQSPGIISDTGNTSEDGDLEASRNRKRSNEVQDPQNKSLNKEAITFPRVYSTRSSLGSPKKIFPQDSRSLSNQENNSQTSTTEELMDIGKSIGDSLIKHFNVQSPSISHSPTSQSPSSRIQSPVKNTTNVSKTQKSIDRNQSLPSFRKSRKSLISNSSSSLKSMIVVADIHQNDEKRDSHTGSIAPVVSYQSALVDEANNSSLNLVGDRSINLPDVNATMANGNGRQDFLNNNGSGILGKSLCSRSTVQLPLERFLEKLCPKSTMEKATASSSKRQHSLLDIYKDLSQEKVAKSRKTTNTKANLRKSGKNKSSKKISVPFSTTKKVFSHYCKHRVAKEGFKVTESFAHSFFKNLSTDLTSIATSQKSSTITTNHVFLLMKQMKLISSWDDLYHLVREYLPKECWDPIIPTTYPHGIVSAQNKRKKSKFRT